MNVRIPTILLAAFLFAPVAFCSPALRAGIDNAADDKGARDVTGTHREEAPGFLLLAPDRGFLGNDEMQDVLDRFQRYVPGSGLAFVTVERTQENLEEAVSDLRSLTGTSSIVVLPLFMSEHEALFMQAAEILRRDSDVVIAPTFGSDYLAEEILFDRLDSLGAGTPGDYLVVLADGAGSAENAGSISDDLQVMSARAVAKYGFTGGETIVLHGRSSDVERQSISDAVARIRTLASSHERILLVPMNFGIRMTTMMSHWSGIEGAVSAMQNVVAAEPEIAGHENVLRWLRRSAAAFGPLQRDEIGVILIPHGSDHNWNETMREGFAPLADEYVMEEAFSMVDTYVVERAVRRLEDRGMKAAVVLRVFSLESSFRDRAEYILGLRDAMPGSPGAHSGGHHLAGTNGEGADPSAAQYDPGHHNAAGNQAAASHHDPASHHGAANHDSAAASHDSAGHHAAASHDPAGHHAAASHDPASHHAANQQAGGHGTNAAPQAGGHNHGGAFPERIESHLLFTTLGGVEADPRFARALIDRIHEISEDPARETVILLGHGTGDDAENDHWMQNLAKIADYIREHDPNTYRDIRYHTWREDWPEKRAVTVPEIRGMVEQASENGGTALVIPVRTAAQGPARDFMPDLEFKVGRGFAPHPEFAAWVREQIEEGIRRITSSRQVDARRGD